MAKEDLKEGSSAARGKGAPVRTYNDSAFRSRTIVLADGRAFDVVKSSIATSDPALIAHLDASAEFKLVEG